jgi:nucleotide-binding universal stress UspA family protein
MQKDLERHFDTCTLTAPDHILVVTDLTDMEYLEPHVIAQANSTGARITLVHAILPSEFSPRDPAAIPYADRMKIIRDARLTLQGMVHPIEARGITCTTAVRAGSAREVIREQLDETGAARLILGTHGRGKLGQLALGSVAQELISSTNIPVFLVGPRARESVEHVIPKKILHPVSLVGNFRRP